MTEEINIESFEVTKGGIAFPKRHGFYFAFFERQSDDTIHWNNPFTHLRAMSDVKYLAQSYVSKGNSG